HSELTEEPKELLPDVSNALRDEEVGRSSNEAIREATLTDAGDPTAPNGSAVELGQIDVDESSQDDSNNEAKAVSLPTNYSSPVPVTDRVPDVDDQVNVRTADLAPIQKSTTTSVATIVEPDTSTDFEVWNLIGRDRIGLAYQINWCLERSAGLPTSVL